LTLVAARQLKDKSFVKCKQIIPAIDSHKFAISCYCHFIICSFLMCDVDDMKCIDASMTVNSKEALKVVMGMFNEPSSSGDLHSSCPEADSNFEQQFANDGLLVCCVQVRQMNGCQHS